jgi:hypothetical protein
MLLFEGLLAKYDNVVECKVPGQHSSENNGITNRHFTSYYHLRQMQDHKDSMVFFKSMETGRTLCAGKMLVTASARDVF